MRPMPIIRSRTGCFTCRRRKKKCNEEKPICSGCKRNKLDCHWPAPNKTANSAPQVRSKFAVPAASGSGSGPASSSASASERRPVRLSIAAVAPRPPQHQSSQLREQSAHPQQPLPDAPRIVPAPVTSPPAAPLAVSFRPRTDSHCSTTSTHPDVVIDADMAEAGDGDEAASPSPSPSASSSSTSSAGSAHTIVPERSADYTQSISDALAITNTFQIPDMDPIAAGVPMPMALLPQHGHHSYELLSYYLTRTANSMGNGSTDVNPFIAKLIPLAFSQPLVLQLILAQSAAHRQASAERQPSDEIATRYYTDSLRLFRNVVGEYVSGKEGNTLVLTVGSLILCLTEVAKGDIHGTIFDHLTASKSLLQMLMTRPKSELSDGLPDFLVEYYMHIAASSMISIDPQYNTQPLLSPDIENLARNLLEKRYVGQLCGCWLELLILIPQIFQLGQSMFTTEGHPVIPTPDNIVTFGFLQSQILAFFPDPSVSPYTRLAGLVFKQAVLLYLWTIFGTPQNQNENTAHRQLMDGAVAEAITLLSQFPATVRINTSLCWPLAVIGCCTADASVQQILRTRLQTMLDTIGLGNMRETLVLLEHVWRQPVEDTSPWTLCKAMREHQIWISFA